MSSSSLHISKKFADLIKKYGEDRIMRMMEVLEKRNTWQREHYHKVLKVKRKAAREEAN